MRLGLPISAMGHAAVLLWTLISFSAKSFNAPEESMPVDLVSTKEFSQLMTGTEHGQKAEKPKPMVDKTADPKPVKDPVPKVSEKPPIEPTASEPPPPPEPKPEVKDSKAEPPPPPEPKAEQKDSKPAEPTVDAIAEALKKEEARQLEQKKLEEQRKAEEQKKREEARKRAEAKRIEEARKREEAKKLEERIAALLDTRDPRREAATGAVPNQTPSLGAPTANAPTLSQSELDAMRAKLRDHWSPDEAIFERPDQYVVLVRVQLGRDRRLTAPPQVVSTGSGPLYQATAEAAKRAILLSQPFDMLSLSTYDTWKDMEISFNPREFKTR
jgi:type IV secretory pathway VirB10-like protein